jgi:cobalt-zinc-cadmium efflux system membrane fusion protein
MQREPTKLSFDDKNKRIMRIVGLAFLLLLIAGTTYGLVFAQKEKPNHALTHTFGKPHVENQGQKIVFAKDHPGLKQFEIITLKKGTSLVTIEAPAEVVAVITKSPGSSESVILFETPEITSLFSQYRQSQSNLNRIHKNHLRIKDMYKNQAATGRDLNEVEGELANAHSAKTEFEVRLRSAGFDPVELENAPAKTVWLIANVAENHLHEVQKGETVKTMFSSFPGQVFSGKAEAIGEVVDPVTRTVRVRVTLHDPNGLFLPGMFARCDFGQPQKFTLAIPLRAVVTVEEKNYVFVAKSDFEFERREVTLVNSNLQEGIVLSGIKEGDRVVTSSAMLLKGLSFGY